MTSTYFVSGMFCGTCAQTVEAQIAKFGAVRSARLNFASKLLRVEFHEALDSEDVDSLIEDELARSGFAGKKQDPGWMRTFQDDLRREQAQAVPPWLLATVVFFAMWSSTAAFAKYLGDIEHSAEQLLSTLSTLVGLPAILLGVVPFARAGVRALVRGRTLTLDLFVALGGLSALSLSLFNLWHGSSQTYVDSGAMILVVLLCAKVLEARLAGTFVSRILYHVEDAEPQVERLKDGVRRKLLATQIRVGDVVAFDPGQTVAFDGILESNDALLNLHLLSGESNDQRVDIGAPVLAGAIARSPLQIRVTHPIGHRNIDAWAESALISQSRPHRYSTTLRYWESRLTALALTGAILIGLFRYQQTSQTTLAVEAFFVGVLLFCPCLFVSILPLAKQLAHLALARKGILLQRAECLFDLAGVEHIFFDKTGTLEAVESTYRALDAHSQGLGAQGKSALSNGSQSNLSQGIGDANIHLQARVRSLLAALRQSHHHPIISGLKLDASPPINLGVPELQDLPGSGVTAHWPATQEALIVGRPAYVFHRLKTAHAAAHTRAVLEGLEQQAHVAHQIDACPSEDQSLPSDANQEPLVAYNGAVVGEILTSRLYDERAQKAITTLLNHLPNPQPLSATPSRWSRNHLPHRAPPNPSQSRAPLTILSGDPKPSAGAKYLSLDPQRIVYHGNLSPQEKAQRIAPNSLFVGDGLNDTLALAQATVSLRVGQRVKGFAPVDLQLLEPNLERIRDIWNYSHRFVRVLKQTALLALTYNLIAWTLAALGWFTPLGAVLAMLTSLLLMTASSLRLLRF